MKLLISRKGKGERKRAEMQAVAVGFQIHTDSYSLIM